MVWMKRGESCARMSTRKDWVVWSRARPIKGDRTPREFEQAGKTFFCWKAKCNMKEQGGQEAEEEMEEEGSDNEVNVGGRARRQRGWWKRADIETKLNTVNMTAWVHKECDIMDDDTLFRLQTAWNNLQQKDECSVCLDNLERAYWQGTEVGRMGGYEFQGATFGVDGSCKDSKMWAGRVLQIPGGSGGQMHPSGHRGGRHKSKPTEVGGCHVGTTNGKP